MFVIQLLLLAGLAVGTYYDFATIELSFIAWKSQLGIACGMFFAYLYFMCLIFAHSKLSAGFS